MKQETTISFPISTDGDRNTSENVSDLLILLFFFSVFF